MAVTQYIGARYVPLFATPIEWSATREYDPLTVVTHQGNSYTSRQAVPTGIEIGNEDFWALTGNYNAQIEQYRQEVAQYADRIEQLENTQSSAREGFAEFQYLGSLPAPLSRYQQGGCYLGNDIFVQYTDVNHQLIKFNVISGAIITQATLDLGHGNSLTYNKDTGKIYAFGNFQANAYGTVYVIDPGSLTLDNTFTLDGSFATQDDAYAMCYNPVEETYYVFNSNGWYSQDYQVKNRVMIYDSDFVLKTTKTLPSMGNYISCVSCGDDNRINVIADSPYRLYRFDSQMNLLETVYINDVVSNLRKATEIESCEYYNGNLLCGIRFQTMGVSHCSSYAILGLTSTDIAKVPQSVRKEFISQASIYVNSANDSYNRDGTASNPFQNISEALNCGYVVNVLDITDTSPDDGTVHNINYEGDAVLWIGGRDNPTDGTRRKYTGSFRGARSVRLDGIRLDKATLGPNQGCLLYARNSNLYLNAVTVASEDTSDAYIALVESSEMVLQSQMPNFSYGNIYCDNLSFLKSGAWSVQSEMIPGVVQSDYYVVPWDERFVRTRSMHDFFGVKDDPDTFDMLDFWMPIQADMWLSTSDGNVTHFKPNGLNQRVLTTSGVIGLTVTRREQLTRVQISLPEGIEPTKLVVQS